MSERNRVQLSADELRSYVESLGDVGDPSKLHSTVEVEAPEPSRYAPPKKPTVAR